jgi:thiamine-monophosphate kinase
MARKIITLQDLGEDEIIRRLTHGLPTNARTLAGAGDDCAVLATADPLRHQLFKTDCLIEHIHFLPDAPAPKVGWKALCRCISDIAAMGGQPTEAVITVAAPKNFSWSRLQGIYQGLTKAAERYGVALVGGETSSVPTGAPLFLSIAMLGEVSPQRLVQRSGGKPGDVLFVTGVLGGSIKGWHLNFTPRLAEAQWLAEHFRPTAMMDLSDGLGSDLPRLAIASQVGYMLREDLLPCRKGCSAEQALTDGEDYELVFSVPPKQATPLLTAWAQQFPQLKLTQIGKLTAATQPPESQGWNHFA